VIDGPDVLGKLLDGRHIGEIDGGTVGTGGQEGQRASNTRLRA
jgi:hypothetical protein